MKKMFFLSLVLALLVSGPVVLQAEEVADATYFPAVVFKGTLKSFAGGTFGYVDPKVGSTFELRFDEIETIGGLVFPGGGYIPLSEKFKIIDMDTFSVKEGSGNNASRANGMQWVSLRAVSGEGGHRVTFDLINHGGRGHEDMTVGWVLVEYNNRIVGVGELEGRIYPAEPKPASEQKPE